MIYRRICSSLIDNIWSFRITLHNNPLKWLNCYVIKSENGKNLLIDTGFNREECRNDLIAGMEELGLTADNTDILITHLHSDHSGNAGYLQNQGFKIMMSERDFEAANDNFWYFQRQRMKHEGVDDEMLDSIFDKNPAVRFRSAPYTPELLHEGDILEYGGHRPEGFYTPGHTPGHMCFYDRGNEIMFLGDHVLFDITPNITSRHTVHNALGCYLDSLKRKIILCI